MVAIVKDGAEVDRAAAGDQVIVLTNQTPFYGESGGQTGDAGRIWTPDGLEFAVETTSKPLGRLHAHVGAVVKGEVKVGDGVHLQIDADRRDRIRANHSATHLVHAALRNALGEHVTQKGSLVADDRFRFDFSHPKPLSAVEIADIEAEVNAEIRANEQVSTRLMTPDDAVAAGALALFGEKYGDEVRVLSMGRKPDGSRNFSVELCGGIHVERTGDIGYFDEDGRLWLVGRKSHLIQTADSEMFPLPGEALVVPHPEVDRAALVEGSSGPVLVVERATGSYSTEGGLRQQVLSMLHQTPGYRGVEQLVFHPGMPVDPRHNAKIHREELSDWVKKLGL